MTVCPPDPKKLQQRRLHVMKQIKGAGQSVRSGLSLMCIVCLLCGLLCGFFWLAGESPVLAAGLRRRFSSATGRWYQTSCWKNGSTRG